ncbi:MAG: cobalt-precorrin 5A hydrolase [Candidatus Heteroscillospira sp.]|jgi:cobalt-precorrin 5A hydrolase
MSIYAAAFTARGAELGKRLCAELGGELYVPARLSQQTGLPGFESLSGWTAEVWNRAESLLFIGACGIAVRAIAPHVRDKLTDPAVVSVDEAGRFAVALLSGHVGGANALACRAAAITGGQAVVTTATDVNGLFAVDVFAAKNGLVLSDRRLAKEASAALLDGESLCLCSPWPVSGKVPKGVNLDGEGKKVYITTQNTPADALRLIPRAVTLGIGCRRGTSEEDIERLAVDVLSASGVDIRAVKRVRSIDLKKDEPGLAAFCRKFGLEFVTSTAEELMAVPGVFGASEFVRGVTGCDNVCERAAAMDGEIIIHKTAGNGVTAAAAICPVSLEF